MTPADFALLNDLKIKRAEKLAETGGGSAAKRKLAALEANKKSTADQNHEAFVTDADIMGPRKKAKMDYDERMASIQKGREGREKFGSTKAKRRQNMAPSSSTNREKARNKPIMMTVHSNKVVQKKKASLRDKQVSVIGVQTADSREEVIANPPVSFPDQTACLDRETKEDEALDQEVLGRYHVFCLLYRILVIQCFVFISDRCCHILLNPASLYLAVRYLSLFFFKAGLSKAFHTCSARLFWLGFGISGGAGLCVAKRFKNGQVFSSAQGSFIK